MTKPNSAGGKFNALTLRTRLQELHTEDANFKVAYSKGVAIVTVQVSISEKQYTRAVDKINPDRVVDMFHLMDNIGDFVCPEDIGTTQDDVDSLSAATVSLPAFVLGNEQPSSTTAPDPGVVVEDAEDAEADVLDVEVEVMEHGADISVDPGLDPDHEQEQGPRQLTVGDKVAMLTDTSINYMVLAVGPEFAGLACLHEGIVKLTCAPVQMLGFVNDAPGGAA